jgi:hypothetical protein
MGSSSSIPVLVAEIVLSPVNIGRTSLIETPAGTETAAVSEHREPLL